MAKYSYIAKSQTGEEKSGILEAKDEYQLARILRKEGLLLIKAKLAEKINKKGLKFQLPFLGGVSLTEKMFFTRNLQVMVSSGLSLPRALEILYLQAKNKKFKKALFEIKEKIIKGENFSEALKSHPNIFSELFQSMLKIGEESGTLDEVLKTLTRQMEREHDLQSKIKGALMYPVVIILAMIGIGVMMLILVVPQLAKTFAELNIELPLTTKLVIGLADFLVKRWYLFPFIIIIFAVLCWRILQTKAGKKIINALFLKIPIVSSLIKKSNSAYMLRNLSSLISAGVPIVRSLEITANTLGNIYFKNALQKAAEKVGTGSKLSEALEPYQDVYGVIILQMLKVGEETGETSGILQKLADFFEEEVGNETKNLTAIIEPVLMLFIGGAVGFFAISMIQPMYSMLGGIQ
ncbi:MAG: type II secretion system F family protein [bacterium]|nr:type II secretion system F family protein [bacterium]